MELPRNLGDGAVVSENLFNGSALNVEGIVWLFFRHEGGEGKGVLTKESTNSLSANRRNY